VSPQEEACFDWLGERVGALGGSSRVEAPPPQIEEHPDFTRTSLADNHSLRPNLRAQFAAGRPGAPDILLNAHVDVVPAGGFERAFSPVVEDGEVSGRGAVDTKNNIVMLLGALEFLREAGLGTRSNVYVDFVVEEEIGGNGTLASILGGCPAAQVIVLEPTGLDVYHGHRGCLSFEVTVQGVAAHMGSSDAGLSAIDGAVEVLTAFRLLEQRLAAEARAHPDFRRWRRPTPINVGFIRGGEWHGSFPDRCEIRANLGFLPDYRIDDVKGVLEQMVTTLPAPWSDGRCRLTYSGIHNEAYVSDARAPLVQGLARSLSRQGAAVRPASAWNASCDARYYSRLLDLPVVIFGSGQLDRAHSNDERLSLAELRLGMRVLSDFLASGLPETGEHAR
jgi:acetylornithine deacetylase